MILKVVALPCVQGIKFDLILEAGYVVTLACDEAELRLMGPISIANAIELKVLQWLRDNDYSTDNISLVFC